MPATYEPIQSVTLNTSGQYLVTFSSIPSTFTDLELVLTTTTTSATIVLLWFNGDTAGNYSHTTLVGNGSSASSSRATNATYLTFSPGSSVGTSTTISSLYKAQIFSYANAFNKTALMESSEDRNGSGSTARTVGLWRSTSAISSISLMTANGWFAAGTTATLYGIARA